MTPFKRWRLATIGALLIACVPAMGQERKMVAQPTTAPGSSPALRKLSLTQAVEVALNNSKQLLIAAQAIQRSRGRVNEAYSGFFPTLSADVTQQRLNKGITSQFPGPNGTTVNIPVVLQNQTISTLNATLPVDILGQVRAAVQQSEFLFIAARLDFNRTRNQLVQDVKVGFFDLLRAQDQVGVAEQSVKNAKDRLRITEANLRAGTGTRFDVVRAQTEVADAEQSLISAKNRVNISRATLANLLNIDQNTPLEPDFAPGESDPPVPDFGKELEFGYSNRPEALQSEANLRAAQKGVTLALRSQLPSLGFNWNFQYNPDAGAFGQETQWTASARLTIPIFDAAISRARTQQAKADVSSGKLNQQVVLDTIALEVRQAMLGVTEARDRLAVTSAALSQAQEAYRLAQVRFQAGVTLTPNTSPLLEISDAQTALTRAQNNHINAQYDLQSARARLDRATGRYAFDSKAAPGLTQPKLPK